MGTIIGDEIGTEVDHGVKKNHGKNTFARIVEYPDHDDPQKNGADALPDDPDGGLVGLAPGDDVPDCPQKSQYDACF